MGGLGKSMTGSSRYRCLELSETVQARDKSPTLNPAPFLYRIGAGLVAQSVGRGEAPPTQPNPFPLQDWGWVGAVPQP